MVIKYVIKSRVFQSISISLNIHISCCFMNFIFKLFFMIVNDLNKKVVGRFYKEITIDEYDESDNITYVFPDTKEFISVLNRKFVVKKVISEEKL